MSDTGIVSFEVRGVEPVHGSGRLLALAIVVVDVDGIELVLQGVQVVRGSGGLPEVRAPVFRHPASGQWVPAVLLPPELSEAIAKEVLNISAGGG